MTAIVMLCFAGCGTKILDQPVSAASSTDDGETIVMIRHGEMAAGGLGQLSCMGLNRSLALPNMLIGRFGRANAIFAPNPGGQIQEGKSHTEKYSYVRPLATIEPTAIKLGLPVNAELPYSDIADLQKEVTAPALSNSVIFIAWEHMNAYRFAQRMLTAYGLDPSQVPVWSENNFDMIYIFHITPASKSGTGEPELTFDVQSEGLDGSISDACSG